MQKNATFAFYMPIPFLMSFSFFTRLTLLGLFLNCAFAFGQLTRELPDEGHAPHSTCFYHEHGAVPREHELDIHRVRLQVAFEPKAGKVNGKVTHNFGVLRQRVDSVFFDAPGINIESAKLGETPLRFRMVDKGVIVYPHRPLTWDDQDSISFVYNATPRKGIYFIGWNDPKNLSRKQIWTQGQANDHRYWIPCYDDANDKVITETLITFDSKYEVLSNGVRMNQKDNGNGTVTHYYRMQQPHSLYLLMIAIGNYEVKELKSKSGVPIRLWYYPDQKDRFDNTYRYSAEAVDFMEEHTGIPYPWGAYAQVPVQDFIYGAMENTTATIFGDFFCTDDRSFLDRNYINVNVHELTHQWFGDLITHRAHNQMWLHESFATFYPKLFERKIWGQDQYQYRRRMEHESALNAAKENDYPIVSNRGGTARIYPKGSSVLDMMMYVFGEESYRRVIQDYLRKHAFEVVETNDLYQSFQDVLGLSPDWFFEQWLYRGGEPHYKISYQEVASAGKKKTEVTVRQIHPQYDLVKLFKMPVVFEVHYADGSFDSVRVMVEKETERVLIPNTSGKSIAYVLFDPGSYILKKVTFDRSFEELKAQALNARIMIDRFDAVAAMRNLPLEQKRATLIQVYNQEKFFYVQTEVISQLANDPHAESKALLRKATQNPRAEVRLALIEKIKTISPDLRVAFERLVVDSSYKVQFEALEKMTEQFPDHIEEYLEAANNSYGEGNRVRVKWLEIAAETGNAKMLAQLVDYASVSYEFRTRQNAIEALQRLNHLDAKLAANLVDAAVSPNSRLASTAKAAILQFMKQNDYNREIREYVKSKKWNLAQQEIINNLLN